MCPCVFDCAFVDVEEAFSDFAEGSVCCALFFEDSCDLVFVEYAVLDEELPDSLCHPVCPCLLVMFVARVCPSWVGVGAALNGCRPRWQVFGCGRSAWDCRPVGGDRAGWGVVEASPVLVSQHPAGLRWYRWLGWLVWAAGPKRHGVGAERMNRAYEEEGDGGGWGWGGGGVGDVGTCDLQCEG